MKAKRILAVTLAIITVVGMVACGSKEIKNATSNSKKETVGVSSTKKSTVDKEKKEENKSEQGTGDASSKDKKSTTSKKTNSGKNSDSKEQTSTTPSTEKDIETKVPDHEHMWVLEHQEYQYIKTYVNGCNGCGYPLFTITASGTSNFSNMYSHPACYSEKLGGECTGGGFHSESYTRGYCYNCGGKVSYRQCMWTEMGKICAKNEALGPYEKVRFDQNHFLYFDSCSCGKNIIAIDSATGCGLILKKSTCSICGISEK